MSRNLPALFTEETTKTEQDRIYHLISMDLFDGSTVGTTPDTVGKTITVVKAEDLVRNMDLTISNDTGFSMTTRVDKVEGKVVTVYDTIPAVNATYTVSYIARIDLVDSNYDVTYDSITYMAFPIKFGEMTISSDGSIDKATLAVANVSREITYYIEKYNGLSNHKVSVKTVYEKFLDKVYYVKREAGEYQPGAYYIAGDTVTYNSVKYTCILEGTHSITDTTAFILASEDGEIVSYKDNPTSDVTACISDSYVVDAYMYDETICNFTLEPSLNLDVKLPRRKFFSNSCQWKYKDPHTCKYSGAEPAGHNGCSKTMEACKLRNNLARFGGFPGIDAVRNVWF